MKLSKPQREHLMRLGMKKAHGKDSGLTVHDDMSPGTVGALIRKGFADKAVRSKKGSQITVYWLTEAGIAEFGKVRP